MIYSRREFVGTGCALLAGTAAAGRGVAHAANPVLGMIYPQTVPVTAETMAMYPSGITFLIEGVGLQTMTPAGYDSVIDRIVPTAKKLANAGAQAIMLMGTSLSFYRGAAFNQQLAESIRQATGLPASTMSSAVVEALRAVGGRRLAVPTAYNDEVNRRLQTFLTESGFDVLVVKGMGIERIGEAGNVGAADLQAFAVGVAQSAPTADAMLLSCGGFRTLESIAPIERQCTLPVVSSSPHALWKGVRLLGQSGTAPGYGRLLSKS
jgi:arylmalonate decarboxylase